MFRSFAVAFLGIIAALGVPAHADEFLFELTGSRNASFTIDTDPSSFTDLQSDFADVAGIFDGAPGIASLINFSAAPGIANLNIVGTTLGFTQFAGPPLFTGPTSAPEFIPGTYALSSIVSGASVLTISTGTALAVPEPATWALLLGGFALTGIAVRRSRSRAAA